MRACSSCKSGSRVGKVDAVFTEVALRLGLIPFELHENECMHTCMLLSSGEFGAQNRADAVCITPRKTCKATWRGLGPRRIPGPVEAPHSQVRDRWLVRFNLLLASQLLASPPFA